MSIAVQASFLSATGTTGTAAAEIIPAASVPLVITEIEFATDSGAATTVGLGVPAAAGGTPTKKIFVATDPTLTYTVQTNYAIAWATGPTAPTTFMRVATTRAAVGWGVHWLWDYGQFVVPAGKTVVLWFGATSAKIDVSIFGFEG